MPGAETGGTEMWDAAVNGIHPFVIGEGGLLVLLILAGAAFVHGVLGMGFPLIATPLVALITDVRTAMVLILLPTLAVNLVNIAAGGQWRRSIGRFWFLPVYGAAGSLLGTRLLVGTDPAPYKLLLAAAVLAYLFVSRNGVSMGWIRRRPNSAALVFGFTGGVLAGTVNVMLPALIIYGLEIRMERQVMVQTFNFCFLVGKLSQGAVFAGTGLMTFRDAAAALPLAALCTAVLAAGMAIRGRVPLALYQRWLRGLLLILSLVLIGHYLHSL